MTKCLYAFYDRVGGTYSAPIVAIDNKPAMVRGIKSMLAEHGNQPWQVYPQDHELYKLGTYDDDTGVIVAAEKPDFVLKLSDLLEV